MASDGTGATWEGACEFTVNAPVEKAWSILSDFGGFADWATSVLEGCSLVEGLPQEIGCVRLVKGKPSVDGFALEATEKLLELDHSRYVISWEVTTCNAPLFAGATSTIQLSRPENPHGTTRIVCRCKRDPSLDLDQQTFLYAVHSLFSKVDSDLLQALGSIA